MHTTLPHTLHTCRTNAQTLNVCSIEHGNESLTSYCPQHSVNTKIPAVTNTYER